MARQSAILRSITVSFFCVGLFAAPALWAHEEFHTHAGLTRVIFEYLENYWDREGLNPNQRPTSSDAALARQGAIDEDDCPLYYSHFYNPNAGTLAGSNVDASRETVDIVDTNCSWTDDPDNVGKPGAELFYVQQMAIDRAAELWDCAKQVYRGSSCTEPTLKRVHPAGRAEAFKLLGHILHLLEDMTSPAHVHNDPHGKFKPQRSGSDCGLGTGQDSDDFENWGWCNQDLLHPNPDKNHDHIRDYVTKDGGIDAEMTQYMVDNLSKLYLGEPQGVSGSLDPVTKTIPNRAHAFVAHVARRVYDFTTFQVKLREEPDVQLDSELKRMLRGSTEDDCDNLPIPNPPKNGLCDVALGWQIFGDTTPQDVGFSVGACGRSEGAAESREEWWPMANGHVGACTSNKNILGNIVETSGFAYIENTGGEGINSRGEPDSFVPLRYGCDPGDENTCGGAEKSKELFRRLYGKNTNLDDHSVPGRPKRKKTQLRIYGDVLYATAVAYGAGLVQIFIEEVNKPTAVAGGPYSGEACQPIQFDASASSDQDDGFIVSYSWDFTDNGVFDVTTASPVITHAYPEPFNGNAILLVTDNDGFTDDDSADVTVTPDITPPNLANMTVTPNLLWPPNHKMQRVHVDPKADDACGIASCQIVLVTSNEPSNSVGDGNTSPDVEITGDLTLMLRAERSGKGSNRIYTITAQCTDVNGNSSTGDVIVTVPHSRSRNLVAQTDGPQQTPRRALPQGRQIKGPRLDFNW